ncbi:MAG TPA: bifunctional DNA primase/polymerase [Gammaproteobacteria bacterium]|nr:bifunctional DNA primase/polymerase [Gammaproteobacteria bacterium]
MIELQLSKPEFRFVKVFGKRKEPCEKNWQTYSNYPYNNPNLLYHIKEGGNVSLLCGPGNIIAIDFDDEEFEKKYYPLLPKTLVHESGSGKKHLFYIADKPENFNIIDPKTKKTLCDLQCNKKLIIIPPSIHPNGKPYTILENNPISHTEMSEIKAIFSEHLKKKDLQETPKNLKHNLPSIKHELQNYGIDTTINPTRCPAHKDHGAKCLHITNDEVWYCHHPNCQKGGNIIHLIMNAENISYNKACEKLGLNIIGEIKKVEQAKQKIDEYIIKKVHDKIGIFWVQYWNEDKKEFSSVRSEKFKGWLILKLYHLNIYKSRWINDIIDLFAAEIQQEEIIELNYRTSIIDGVWYFQLTPYEGLTIYEGKINKMELPPIFRINGGTEDLILDWKAEIEDINLLDKYTNFTTPSELELFKNTLPCYLIPNIQKPVQLVSGPACSGKSTLGRMTKKIIDPSVIDCGMDIPKTDEGWFINCINHKFLFYDNLGYFTKEQQDKICKIINGQGLEKRKLYTDDETQRSNFKVNFSLNGLGLTGSNSDLIDRSFIWELERIKEDKMMGETEFWVNFENDLPKIRGALFKILAESQTHLNKVKNIPNLRFRDFAEWGAACSLARNKPLEDYFQQLTSKTELQKESTIEQNNIILPIQKFMEDREEWEGYIEDFYKELTKQEYGEIIGEGSNERIVIPKYLPKSWPRDQKVLSREITKIRFMLEKMNVFIYKTRDMYKKKIILSKKPITPNNQQTTLVG